MYDDWTQNGWENRQKHMAELWDTLYADVIANIILSHIFINLKIVFNSWNMILKFKSFIQLGTFITVHRIAENTENNCRKHHTKYRKHILKFEKQLFHTR